MTSNAGLRSAGRGGAEEAAESSRGQDRIQPCYQHVGAECAHSSTATRTFFSHFGTNRTQGPNGDTLEVWNETNNQTHEPTSGIQPD
jgi:hypothetical protein